MSRRERREFTEELKLQMVKYYKLPYPKIYFSLFD